MSANTTGNEGEPTVESRKGGSESPKKSSSWADETATTPHQPSLEPAATTGNEPTAIPQVDGAVGVLGGSSGIMEPSYDVDVKLSDMQANPDNPLYSIKSFQELGLDDRILKGIYQMRFTKPSKIQERALPLLLSNPPMNLIGQSQSGTGKTAAFVLNILSRLEFDNPAMQQVPQALIIAPTRELARQIMGVVQVMGQFIDGLTVLPAIPLDIVNRGKELKGQVVVGTPGTVMDLIKKRLLLANKIKVLVLDEADTMLDLQGLGDQCIRVKMLADHHCCQEYPADSSPPGCYRRTSKQSCSQQHFRNRSQPTL